jgi:hypothetical protein
MFMRNGGKLLTPEQKDQYDEYYIRNASPWFDLHIAFMTLKVVFRRGNQSDHEVAANFGGLSKIDRPRPVIPMPRPTDRLGNTRLHEKELPPFGLGGVELSAETIAGRKSGKPNA